MKKALIVDDVRGIRQFLQQCLQDENFSVETCGDGKSALEHLTAQRYDLIVLDIKLPLVSGTEVLKRMREYGVETPVIITTAFGSIRNAIDCTKLGAVAYIQKPFSEGRILSVLEQYGLRGETQPSPAVDAGKRLAELQARLSQDPLSADVYRMLAETSRALGREKDAEQYQKIFDSFGKNG